MTEWLQGEVSRLADARPQLVHAVRVLHRARMWLLPLVAWLLGGTLQAWSPCADAQMFMSAGERLFTPAGLDVFADPYFQIGPAYLGLNAVAGAVAHTTHLPPLFVIAGAVGAAVTWLLMRLTASITGRRGADVAVALAFVLGGPLALMSMQGHLEEVLVALLILVAMEQAEHGRSRQAALLIGLAVSIKLWGVLGVPLLVVGVRPRIAVGRAALALAVPAAAYAPFFLWGTVNTFSFAWVVAPGSPLSLLVDTGSAFDWRLRLLQAAGASIAGALLLWSGRREPWRVVTVLLAVRLLLDPNAFGYYGIPLLLILVMAAWSREPAAGIGTPLLATVLVPAVVALFLVVPGRPQAVIEVAVLIAAALGAAGMVPLRRAAPAHPLLA